MKKLILDVGELTYERWQTDIRHWQNDIVCYQSCRQVVSLCLFVLLLFALASRLLAFFFLHCCLLFPFIFFIFASFVAAFSRLRTFISICARVCISFYRPLVILRMLLRVSRGLGAFP